MTNAQLSKALALAKTKNDLQHADITPFDGFGMKDFQPITCTIAQVARLIRWQCFMFNGQIDGKALDEIAYFGARKFTVLDDKPEYRIVQRADGQWEVIDELGTVCDGPFAKRFDAYHVQRDLVAAM